MTHSINQWMSNGGVCKTAPATPGLPNIIVNWQVFFFILFDNYFYELNFSEDPCCLTAPLYNGQRGSYSSAQLNNWEHSDLTVQVKWVRLCFNTHLQVNIDLYALGSKKKYFLILFWFWKNPKDDGDCTVADKTANICSCIWTTGIKVWLRQFVNIEYQPEPLPQTINF